MATSASDEASSGAGNTESTAASASDEASGAGSSESIAVAAGSHVLEVQGYSRIKGSFRIGDSICSGKFQVGAHTWRIDCYPCGKDDEDRATADWVGAGIYLSLCKPGRGDRAKARFCFTLLGHDGNTSNELMETMQQRTFTRTRDTFGGDFIKREQVESPLYLKNDCFRVRCNVTIVEDFGRSSEAAAAAAHVPAAAPSPDLRRHLGGLLTSQQVGGDVTFEVGGELFTAHNCVLAAGSSAFMAQFFGPGNDNTCTTAAQIQIDDMKPEVFKALLRFIYTDTLPEVEDCDKVVMAQSLLVAADRYCMERLKLICGDMLCNHVDASTAATSLLLAKKHGCCRLKKACLSFLRDLLADADP